jgi:hypothetical protein
MDYHLKLSLKGEFNEISLDDVHLCFLHWMLYG